MLHLDRLLVGVLAAAVLGTPASAQTWVSQTWSETRQTTSSRITASLNRQSSVEAARTYGIDRGAAAPAASVPGPARFDPAVEHAFGPVVEFNDAYAATGPRDAFATTTTHDLWREGDGHEDRLRLRTRGLIQRADGSPLPLSPLDPATFATEGYDLSFTRGWPVARGYTTSGLEVTLTPHAGLGVGDRGGTAEAGATLRIGQGLNRLLPNGASTFGERTRWYLYVAGSGTAVGYNFARNRDGDYARSGVSHDSGNFLGDASIGVALRKGDMQGSFGVVYREVNADGLRSGRGLDTDVSEGLVAFQLSIKPEW